MDNDLMARRLRPPSEPMSPLPAGPMPTPTWMQQQTAAPTIEPSPVDPPVPTPRDAVPWDRPSDYVQPTDTASAGDQAWDRPDNQGWDNSAVYDDRTADMLEPEPEIYGAVVAAATASESAVAQAVASFGATPQTEGPRPRIAFDPENDPDDAFAPVLEDVYAVPATGWHEPTAYREVDENGQSAADTAGDAWADAWQASTQTVSPPGPVEPPDLQGTGVGPTPPADLFTDAPSIWSAALVDQPSVEAVHELPDQGDSAAHEQQAYERPAFEPQAYQEPAFEPQAYQEPGFEPQAYQEPQFEQEASQEPAFEQQAHQEPAFEQQAHAEPQVEQQADTEQAYHEPEFEQQADTEQAFQPSTEDGERYRDAEEAASVGVTAEQAWQAYEAFTTEPQAVAHTAEPSEPPAVFEIEVPHPATTAPPDAARPQQLVLRIELVIVDGNGQRVDPANVAVRVSPIEPAETEPTRPVEASAMATALQRDATDATDATDSTDASDAASAAPRSAEEPGAVAEARAFAEAPWPVDVQPPVEPEAPGPGAVQLAWPPQPAATVQPLWAQQPINDPLSTLSAPPPPATHNSTTPAFAPPSFAPPPSPGRAEAPTHAVPASTTEAVSRSVTGEQREPSFRGPPGFAANGQAIAASTGGTRVVLWTVGVGVLVVLLVLGFLRLITNIL